MTDKDEILSLEDINQAEQRIRPYLRETPFTRSHALSSRLKREVYIKWDNKFVSGAFKERGALNFLLSMSAELQKKGVCAGSAGNHALGLSHHAQRHGVPCSIVMPAYAPLVKVEAVRTTGAEVILHGQNLTEVFQKAHQIADDRGMTFVPPFDHRDIMAGQGVSALEIMRLSQDFDAVVVPVGGGGYIAGVATAIKASRPDVAIIGVQSEWSHSAQNDPVLHKKIGPVTIADGIALKSIGNLTSKVIKEKVDLLVTISEEEIAQGIMRFLELEKAVLEGAGSAAISALFADKIPAKYKSVVALVCGSNIDINLLNRIIACDLVKKGRWIKIVTSLPDRPGMLHKVSGIIAQYGANILESHHDRLSSSPGLVDVIFTLEVRNREHSQEVVNGLRKEDILVFDHYCIVE